MRQHTATLEENMHPATLAYLQLGGAILLEVIATACLKQSEGMSRLVPTVTALAGYGVSFFLLSQVLKVVPMGISYGIWSGVGIVIVSVIGLFLFGQKLDLAACIGLGLIVLGVLVINFFSSSVPH
ncbi:SMR family transporter [Desulfovibrio sp. 1188_IL3213]